MPETEFQTVVSDPEAVTPAPMALNIDITKRLGKFRLRTKFEVARGLVVLFGHSGSGKSLTLQAIAGLLRPDAGCIAIEGQPVFDAERRLNTPPQRRGVGMVVQSYALFPHMSVRDNIGYGLHRLSRNEQRKRVDELLKLLGLEDLADRRPRTISGGQAQRVALARALAPRPQLLLLDEPFSALDSAIRTNLRRELSRLKRELDLTIVFVTHDLREAYNLADDIAVFDAGQVLQVGPRDEVFNRPASARVADLMQVRNIWHGTVESLNGPEAYIETGHMSIRTNSEGLSLGAAVDVCIRPERVMLVRSDRLTPEEARDTLVSAEIVDETAHGNSYTLFFRLAGGTSPEGYDIEVELASHPYDVMNVGAQRSWMLALPMDAIHVMLPN